MNVHESTIVAQCTPHGAGALAVIRLSGAEAITIATRFSSVASGIRLIDAASHTIHYGRVVDEKTTTIDQVLFLLMHAPRTFTGENTVEITCHNNPFIIEAIINQAVTHGARRAKEGEFTKQAVLNNKMDLIQAEALNELIHANTQMALKQSLQQLKGSLSQWVHDIEEQLYHALAYSESSFEFIDEEIQFGAQIADIITNIQCKIIDIKKTYTQQQQIRQGVRIALIGTVNAGKSSLFNALLNKDRAIVTNIAGTTRDSIEAGMYKNDTYQTLVDTAGLRHTDDTIEQQGISRSHEEAQQADVILLVIDSTRNLTPDEQAIYESIRSLYPDKIITVYNKIDQTEHCAAHDSATASCVRVSSLTKAHIDQLEGLIAEKIATLFNHLESPFLLNQRQFNLILELEQKLTVIQQMLTGPIAYELLSCHLQEALENLTEFSGKTISEKGMDTVFRNFCIGK